MMKKLIPLFGILLAAIVVMSTGAFTSVTADREATINVSGDASALLGLEAHAPYASYDDDGALVVELPSGVNVDAETDLGKVFTIYYNGTRDVTVWVHQMLGATDVTETSPILFTSSSEGNPSNMQAVWNTPLGSGDSIDVYIKVYTNMQGQYPYQIGTIMDSMTIVAE